MYICLELGVSYLVRERRAWKIELSIEDQKINFDLFDEEKHLLDKNVCLKANEQKAEVLKNGTKFDPDPQQLLDQNVYLKENEFNEEVLNVGTKFDPDP